MRSVTGAVKGELKQLESSLVVRPFADEEDDVLIPYTKGRKC